MSITSLFYTLARLSRDVNSVARGPRAVAKRQICKAAFKSVAKGLRWL